MEKINIYTDTNMVHDFFVNQAKALKGKELFRMPEKLEFFLSNLDKLGFVTSFIVKAEVMRELVAGHQIDKGTVNSMWTDFVKLLNCRYIEKFEFDEKLVDIAGDLKLKLRTLVNFTHLFIAMSEDVYIVSGDKDLIDKVRENKIYKKILSYIELHQLIASPSQGF